MEKPTRIAKWDNIKLFLMLCVILGHIDNYVGLEADNTNRVYLFIYAFHMPAFIFVSGLFSKHAIKHRRIDKAFTFFALYFVIKFSMFFMRLALDRADTFRLFNTDGVEWYALGVFLFYLLTMALQRIDGRYLIPAAIFFGCMAGYDLRLGGNWVLNRVTAFYPFFLLGFYLDAEKVAAFCSRLWVRLAGLAALIAAGVTAALTYDDLKWIILVLKGYSYRNLEEDLFYWGGLIRLGCYAVAVLMTIGVLALVPSVKGFWSTIGSRTLSIYAFHFPVIMWLCTSTGLGWKREMRHMTDGKVLAAMIAIAVVISLVLSLKPIYWFVRLLTVPPLRRQTEAPPRDRQDTAPLPDPPAAEPQSTGIEYGTYEAEEQTEGKP